MYKTRKKRKKKQKKSRKEHCWIFWKAREECQKNLGRNAWFVSWFCQTLEIKFERVSREKEAFPESFRAFDKLLNRPIIFVLIIRKARIFTRAIADIEVNISRQGFRRPLVESKYTDRVCSMIIVGNWVHRSLPISRVTSRFLQLVGRIEILDATKCLRR